MILLLSVVFGLVAGNDQLCDLLADTETMQFELPTDLLDANLKFKGFVPTATHATSTTGAAYVEITGYSTLPEVDVGAEVVVSPASCAGQGFVSGSMLSSSWFPFACTAATAMLSSEQRMFAAIPFLAWAPGATATETTCTPTIEVTIYTPPPLNVARSGCQSQIAKSRTTDRIAGGTLYVHDPTAAGSKTWVTIADKSYVDLADESIKAGCVPRHKPHMVIPSPDNKHTITTYTGDTDYAVLRNSDYQIVACPTVDYLKPRVFGGAVHAGAWYSRDTFLSVDMTGCVDGVCGGAIHRHDFTYAANGDMQDSMYNSSLSHAGVADARGTSSVGTKPIALGNNPHGQFSSLFYVTDAKGGGSIMNADSMTWAHHFDVSAFGNCSGGGLWVEPHAEDPRIVLVQYGKQDGASCIFKVNVADLTIQKLVQLPDNRDAHGLQLCYPDAGGAYVLNTNRQTATLDVIDYSDGSFVVHDYDLNAEVFDAVQTAFRKESGTRRLNNQVDKLQPDVAFLASDVGFLYMAARGPRPISVVKPQNFYENAHPGLMALAIDMATCLPKENQSEAYILTTLERSPEVTSDVHSVWGVQMGGSTVIWAIDQAGTGSVQQYDVYSNCAAIGVDPSEFHDDPSPHSGD